MQQRFNAKLISKKFISETVLEIVYECPVQLEYAVGQFASIAVTPPFRRPYSIIFYEDNKLGFLIEVKDPGNGADYFRNAEVGIETDIRAPLGRYEVLINEFPKVFISTGAGVAPFIPMIKKLVKGEQKLKVDLFCGMGLKKDDLAYYYIKDCIAMDEVNYYRCITREEITLDEDNKVMMHKGRVTEVVPKMHYDWVNTEFYICGSNQMIKDMRAKLQEKGAEKILVENYG